MQEFTSLTNFVFPYLDAYFVKEIQKMFILKIFSEHRVIFDQRIMCIAVSYTHLDVYKRQVDSDECWW